MKKRVIPNSSPGVHDEVVTWIFRGLEWWWTRRVNNISGKSERNTWESELGLGPDFAREFTYAYALSRPRPSLSPFSFNDIYVL